METTNMSSRNDLHCYICCSIVMKLQTYLGYLTIFGHDFSWWFVSCTCPSSLACFNGFIQNNIWAVDTALNLRISTRYLCMLLVDTLPWVIPETPLHCLCTTVVVEPQLRPWTLPLCPCSNSTTTSHTSEVFGLACSSCVFKLMSQHAWNCRRHCLSSPLTNGCRIECE